MRRKSEQGSAAVEYALIASLVALIIVPTMKIIGTNMETVFNHIITALK